MDLEELPITQTNAESDVLANKKASAEDYYFHNGIEILGPFKLSKINVLEIKMDWHVWKDGLEDWIAVVALPELKDLIAPPPFDRKTPPPFNKNK